MPEEQRPATLRVAEISARSKESFEDAIKIAINSVGADRIGEVKSAWVKEQSVEPNLPDYWFRVSVLISLVTPGGKPLML